MGKIAAYITFVWLVGSPFFGFAIGCNGHIRNNVSDTLQSYLWVKEATGNNDGYWVEKFIGSTGLNPKGQYPWCAAFITYVFKVNNLDVPKYPARAASWFNEAHLIPNEKAIQGDLGSLYYRKLGRIGHIVMYLQPFINNTPYVVTGEGNTNAQGSREGNQAARRIRPRGIIHSSADWITNRKNNKSCLH